LNKSKLCEYTINEDLLCISITLIFFRCYSSLATIVFQSKTSK